MARPIGWLTLGIGLAAAAMVTSATADPVASNWIQSSSKYTESASTAPGSITIISSEEISTHGYTTLAEALSSVRGLYNSYDRAYDATGLRGYVRSSAANSGILVMIDGHRINDPIYNSAATGTNFPIDMEIVERIEVTRGGASAIHGNDASLGMVNVITKDLTGVDGGRVSAMAASYDTYAGGLQFGRRSNETFAMQVSASATGMGGQGLYFADFDQASTNFGTTDPESDESSFVKLHTGIEMGAWQLTAFHVTHDKHVPIVGAASIFNDPRRLARDERTGVDLSTTADFWDYSQVSVRFSYDRYRYKLNDPQEITSGSSPLEYLGRVRAQAQTVGADVNMTRQQSDVGTLLLGAEYRSQFELDQELNDEINGVLFDSNRTAWDWSVYGQEDVKVSDEFSLALGVRHDRFKSFGGTTNPRASAVWEASSDVIFKATAGQSFLAPTPFEELFIDPSIAKPNTELDPEKMRSAELMGTFALGQNAALSLGGFFQSIDDRIVLQFDEADGLFFNDNTGEARITGFDAEIDAGMSNGVNATASYTYQDGEDQATGEWLVNSPKHLAKVNIQAPITHPSVMGGLEMQYMSKRRTAADNEVDGNFITNVSVNAKRIFGGIDVAASVMNLMDEEYADPAAANLSLDSVEQNGRNFRLRLGYGF